MIAFSEPLFILLIIPLCVVIYFFYRIQNRSLDLIKANVSRRFIGMMTSYNSLILILHSVVLFLMGLFLIIAISGPNIAGDREEDVKADNLIFLLDASLSMVAEDISAVKGLNSSKNRKEQAINIFIKIIKRYPKKKYGLISFSGMTAFHSPITSNTDVIKHMLKTMRLHVLQKTGTNFKSALQAAIHFINDSKIKGFQVILISDGEENKAESFSDELTVFKKLKIPIHSIGVGTSRGSGIVIFKPEDVLSGKNKPATIKSITTKRKDKNLKKIAYETGGEYIINEKEKTKNSLLKKIDKIYIKDVKTFKKGKIDISYLFVLLFFFLFFADVVVFDNKNFFKPYAFKIIERIKG